MARVFKREGEQGPEFALEFEEPVRAITPGQAAVIYRDQQLVGGGWIV
jgi:tRNA-specific 2-thiouridylase